MLAIDTQSYFTYVTAKELEGCWDDVLWHVKIAVERCGCNSGSRLVGPVSYIIAFSFALAVVLVR